MGKGEIKSLDNIIEEMDEEVLKRIVLHKARNDPEFEETLRIAAMGKDEVYEQIKKAIANLKKSRKFYDWRARNELYQQLENILENIRTNIVDSEKGIDLLVRFLSLDATCCNNCDDSDGGLGYEFNSHAMEVMIPFAQKFSDKEKLTEIIYELLQTNDYGCHDGVLQNINCLLPKEKIRELLNRDFNGSYIKPDLAFALGDAPLFEKLLKENRPNGFSEYYDYSELAECYFVYGDYDKALHFTDLIPSHNSKKNGLYEKIYLANKNIDGLKNIYSENYMRYPSEETKSKIIALCGEPFFEELYKERINSVIENPAFSESDMIFLMENNLVDLAEEYILNRKEKIADKYFQSDFIKKIKKTCTPLVQTLVCRVPLNYYLDNAKSKYYSSAVKHLKFLCEISNKVIDWKGVHPHDVYFEELKKKHFRKHSFWSCFE
ncbi:MAG: hypothetical protein PUJ82_12720 [Spirochaetales bacterium]|nr:hypothetical protein [Spirochaetales bacterium]MDD7611770.1 hypothetical protein [Spirochaetales bacterium]MDY5915435.1 hypothetical protein [Treponema sp.]